MLKEIEVTPIFQIIDLLIPPRVSGDAYGVI